MSKMTAALFMIIAVMFMLVAPESTIAQDKQTFGLAVLDLQAIGISETEALSLSEILRSGISRTLAEQKNKIKAEYKLLERSQTEKILDEFKVQSTGCTDVECAVEFGKMFAVDRIIIGSVGLVGSTYTIIARIVDVETGSILSIVNRKQRGEIDNIIDLMPLIGHELLTGEQLAAPVLSTTQVPQSISTRTPSTISPPLAQPIQEHYLSIKLNTITGGTFQMGDVDGGGDSDEKPVHTVTVSSFEMSAYEITNSQYAQYLNEAFNLGKITGSGNVVNGKDGEFSGQKYLDMGYSYDSNNKCWIQYNSGTFTVVSDKENLPVVNVTWYGAKAFALYYGLDLPTEAEWEYACRGGKQYNYGTDNGTISTRNVNYKDTGIGYPVGVGSYTNNPFLLYDISGNVYEWCNDWYGRYPNGSLTNPTGPMSGSYRVFRGGGWNNSTKNCRSADRNGFNPSRSYVNLGFRVIRRL